MLYSDKIKFHYLKIKLSFYTLFLDGEFAGKTPVFNHS